MTTVRAVEAEEFRGLATEAASVYGAAMRRSPAVVIQRRDVIAVHVSYGGFVASGAFEAASGAFEVASGAFEAASGAFEAASGAFEAASDAFEAASGGSDAAGEARRLLGFGYGYLGAAGQWWHDIVAGALGREQSARWLRDGFELAELHVLPEHHGHGLGRALLTDVLSRTSGRHAVLSTPDIESPARRLYRSYGFVDLRTGFRFPGSSEPYAIMGVDL